MKKIMKALLGGLILSIVLCTLFPIVFLKGNALWTYKSGFGRIDIAFAGGTRNGQISVQGDTSRVDRPRWLCDGKNNQGVTIHFPVSYLQKSYQITLTPSGEAKELSLMMSFRGQDLGTDKRNKPVYVRFENIQLNDKTLILEKTVRHDKPFRYHAKNLSDNSPVTLSFEIRKPISPSDIKWGSIIGLFIAADFLF